MKKLIKLTNRRGMTLILMAFMLTAMIGLSAFVVDFGQMYLYKAQLQAAADAAALAGVMEFQRGFGTAARDTSIAYDTLHKVGTSNQTLALVDDSVGTWTMAGGVACPSGPAPCFTADGGVNAWNNTANDAVKVVTRYTGQYGAFGRFLGFTTKSLTATAVAAWGSSNSSTCVRPWAVPYQSLLDVLYPPAGTKPVSYQLTANDLTRLARQTADSNVQLKVGTAGDLTPNGEFYAARLPAAEYADGTVGNPWTGGQDYSDAIGQSCTQLAAHIAAQGGRGTISIGDWLRPETGNKQGPTKSGVDALCGSDTCNPPVKLVVALWDTEGPSTNGTCTAVQPCYHVKYLGVFTITGFDQPNKAVNGFFNTMTSETATGFTAGSGPGGATSPVIIFSLVK